MPHLLLLSALVVIINWRLVFYTHLKVRASWSEPSLLTPPPPTKTNGNERMVGSRSFWCFLRSVPLFRKAPRPETVRFSLCSVQSFSFIRWWCWWWWCWMMWWVSKWMGLETVVFVLIIIVNGNRCIDSWLWNSIGSITSANPFTRPFICPPTRPSFRVCLII